MNDISKLRKAYWYNLKEVLNWVPACINGKTFITADHGEGLGAEMEILRNGEWRTFEGHPATNVVGEVEVLRKVPFEVVE